MTASIQDTSSDINDISTADNSGQADLSSTKIPYSTPENLIGLIQNKDKSPNIDNASSETRESKPLETDNKIPFENIITPTVAVTINQDLHPGKKQETLDNQMSHHISQAVEEQASTKPINLDIPTETSINSTEDIETQPLTTLQNVDDVELQQTSVEEIITEEGSNDVIDSQEAERKRLELEELIKKQETPTPAPDVNIEPVQTKFVSEAEQRGNELEKLAKHTLSQEDTIPSQSTQDTTPLPFEDNLSEQPLPEPPPLPVQQLISNDEQNVIEDVEVNDSIEDTLPSGTTDQSEETLPVLPPLPEQDDDNLSETIAHSEETIPEPPPLPGLNQETVKPDTNKEQLVEEEPKLDHNKVTPNPDDIDYFSRKITEFEQRILKLEQTVSQWV